MAPIKAQLFTWTSQIFFLSINLPIPTQVLQLIKERRNICKMLHLPAQSGNSEVLERMRRGYTREAYLALVDKIRSIIPGVSLSSDFIAGFCGETEAQFEDTLSLLELVRYRVAYLFAYSMREVIRSLYLPPYKVSYNLF